MGLSFKPTTSSVHKLLDLYSQLTKPAPTTIISADMKHSWVDSWLKTKPLKDYEPSMTFSNLKTVLLLISALLIILFFFLVNTKGWWVGLLISFLYTGSALNAYTIRKYKIGFVGGFIDRILTLNEKDPQRKKETASNLLLHKLALGLSYFFYYILNLCIIAMISSYFLQIIAH